MEPWKRIFHDAAVRTKWERYVAGWESLIHAFLQFDPDLGLALDRKNGGGSLLRDVPFAVKDNIAVQGFNLTCGSKMLEEHTSPYTATAVGKLVDRGAVPIGKTNLDEFGMGSSTDNSALCRTNNPWDLSRVAGGSSGGSAAAVAAGLVPFALGSDTGGSIRQPAAFCGVYGLKPTYGTVSRYGLVAYASSLEVIGVIARSAGLAEEVYGCIKGADPLDHSSLAPPETEKDGEGPVKTIGVLKADLLDVREEVRRGYENTVRKLRDLGYTTVETEIPGLEYTVPAYYTIAAAEASSNLARYNGIRYGHRPGDAESYEETVMRSRSEAFGPEVKLRVLLGTYVLRSGFQDQYYVRAQKIRTAIRRGFDQAFAEADCILMPVYPTNAFPRGEGGLSQFEQKLADRFTGSANLAGIPALSFPAGLTGGAADGGAAGEASVPVGMQILAPNFAENRLFQVARRWEESFPVPECSGYTEEWR